MNRNNIITLSTVIFILGVILGWFINNRDIKDSKINSNTTSKLVELKIMDSNNTGNIIYQSDKFQYQIELPIKFTVTTSVAYDDSQYLTFTSSTEGTKNITPTGKQFRFAAHPNSNHLSAADVEGFQTWLASFESPINIIDIREIKVNSNRGFATHQIDTGGEVESPHYYFISSRFVYDFGSVDYTDEEMEQNLKLFSFNNI